MSCTSTPCCPCQGPYYVKPGETTNLYIDWSEWLANQSGYSLSDSPVPEAVVNNISGTTPVVPLPAEFEIVETGAANLLLTRIQGKPHMSRMQIKVGRTVAVGTKFKIDIMQYARGCDPDMGTINVPECILIEVANC